MIILRVEDSFYINMEDDNVNILRLFFSIIKVHFKRTIFMSIKRHLVPKKPPLKCF